MRILLKNSFYSLLYGNCVRLSLLSLLFSPLFIGGCAVGLALNPDTQKVEIDDKALVLIAVELDNEYKSVFLTPESIELVRVDDPSGTPNIFVKPFMVSPEILPQKGSTLSFLNFYLEPGSYEIIGLTGGVSRRDLPASLGYGVPKPSPRFYARDFKAPFTARAGIVYYLGRIKLLFSEKKSDDEPVALSGMGGYTNMAQAIGGVVGLKMSGLDKATIKIACLDNHADDIPAFSSRYKALANIEINSSAIPDLTAPDYMKMVDKQVLAETRNFLSALRSESYNTRMDALKSLSRSPTNDVETYDFINTDLMNSYMVGENRTDELAWMCKTLAASGLDKYKQSLMKVIETTNNSKLKRHCSSSLSTLNNKK